MSAARMMWLLWCLGWFAFWLTLGWFLIPVINLAFAVFSLIACIPAFFRNSGYSDQRRF